jgi:hypothetical protein
MMGIGALARELAGVLEMPKTFTLEQSRDDHLSERVSNIDQALDELADEYEALWSDSQTYPTSERLTGLG